MTAMAQRRATKASARSETEDAYVAPPDWVLALGLRHSLFLLAAITDAPMASSYRYGKSRSRLAPHWGFAAQMLNELVECGAVELRAYSEPYRAWAPAPPPTSEPEWQLTATFAAASHLQAHVAAHAKSLAAMPAAGDELYTIWRELAISEAAGFLSNELGEHRFDETWAFAAVPALERGLRRLSVNQMFYFCWMSVRETASRYLRYPASVHNLADGLVTYIEQRVDRALAERWAIREWSYSSRRVPSNVALVFSEQLTDLGAEYLSTVPSRSRLAVPIRPRRTLRGSFGVTDRAR